jgi:sugar (pentulose or hexulose) kinase
MQKVIAVFDIGKTNKKLYLFNDKFQVVFQREEPFPVITDEDGFECDDIDLITNWIENEITTLIKSVEYELVAVNFSTYGASLIFLDNEGKRLTPLYNYLKPVDKNISETLFNNYGGKEEFCRKTASPDLGLLLNSGIQILWMKKTKKVLAEKTQNILHFPQYLSYCLTGEICSEFTSIGCHTMMWDFDNMSYHPWLKEHGISLPEPIANKTVFKVAFKGKNLFVGTGIHDSSASLVPYIKASKSKFILVSTGTWCITMNPFNSEPLTAEQLAQDCLCYLTHTKQQVKSSRLFMGHFHDLMVKKLSLFFDKEPDFFKKVKYSKSLVDTLATKYNSKQIFFPEGKDKAEVTLGRVNLSMFSCYEEAYTKFMIDLTQLFVVSYNLVIPANDETELIYLSGGFSQNEIFVELVKSSIPGKKVIISKTKGSTALGAAMVISDVFEKPDFTELLL